MGLTNVLSERPEKMQQKLHWGGGFALWDICRNKSIGVPVLDMLYEEATDSDLKKLIKDGIERVAIPHIEKIEEFFKKEELTHPAVPQRHTLSNQHIGLSIMEILRLSLALDVKGFTDATREDLRAFIWDIVTDDKKAFDKIIQLNTKKSWMMNPPTM